MKQNKRRRKDLKIDRLSLLLFADNYYVCASSPAMQTQMMEAWHFILRRRYRVVIKHHECYWITTADNSNSAVITLSEGRVTRIPREEGIKMLGAHVSFDGSASTAVQKGIARAWA
eukprot:5897746-Pyramimonas_sp.AAC.1